MVNPAQPPPSLRKNFWIAFILVFVFVFIMKFTTAPLTGKEIVDFELAKTPERANSILQSWKADNLIAVFEKSVYLDFVFIILYSAVFYYGCRFFAYLSGNIILRKTGQGFAFLVLLAAICDIIENIGMLVTIHSVSQRTWMVGLSYDMAVIKFSIIMILVLFMFVCMILWVTNKLVAQPRG